MLHAQVLGKSRGHGLPQPPAALMGQFFPCFVVMTLYLTGPGLLVETLCAWLVSGGDTIMNEL